MTELLPRADRTPWRAGACAPTPADEKVSLPRELERQKRALERAYCDLARKVETLEKRAKQLAEARDAALQNVERQRWPCSALGPAASSVGGRER